MMKKTKKTRKDAANDIGARPMYAPSTEPLSGATSRAELVQSACAKIGCLFTQEELDLALTRYDIGEAVNELRAAEATHGAGLVVDVAKALGRDDDTLYDYARVATLVGRAEFRELALRVNTAGVPLSFSHFVELATKSGKSGKGLREEEWMPLFERALKENLSVRALGKLVREARKGQSIAKTKSESSVAKLMKMTGRLLNDSSKIEGLMVELESDRAAKGGVQLLTTIEQVEKIHAECARTLARLRALQANEGSLFAAAE